MAFSEREIRAALRKKENQSSIQHGEAPVSDEEKVSGVILHCPHCNAVVDDDAVFCQDCGQPLSEKPAPEQILMEEAKGEKLAEPISPSVQPHTPRGEELEEPWSRTLGIPKFGVMVFWGILFLIVCMVTFSLPPPPSPKTDAKLPQNLPATRTRINYKVVHSFYFGSPYGGRSIVIDPKDSGKNNLNNHGLGEIV